MHPRVLRRVLQRARDRRVLGGGESLGEIGVGAQGGVPTIAIPIDAGEQVLIVGLHALAQPARAIGLLQGRDQVALGLVEVGIRSLGQRIRAGLGAPVHAVARRDALDGVAGNDLASQLCHAGVEAIVHHHHHVA